MPNGWKETLAGTGATWNDFVILKPALLTDGACKADTASAGKQPYRFSEEDLGGYTISRKDVGHFIAENLLEDWKKWSGKGISLAY